MSALTSIEAPVVDRDEDAAPSVLGPGSARRPLRLVRATAPDLSGGDAATAHRPEPPASSITATSAGRQPLTDSVLTPSAVLAPRQRRASAPTPLRLTRRGRAVVAGLVVLVIATIALVAGLAAAGGADAANHGQPRAGYQGMREIVVRPGQTLWSIASAAEPGADPRAVVQEIMTANAMTTATISAGQLLWVPR